MNLGFKVGRILLFSDVMPKDEDNFYFVNVAELKPVPAILQDGLALTQEERGRLYPISGERLEPKQFRARIFAVVDSRVELNVAEDEADGGPRRKFKELREEGMGVMAAYRKVVSLFSGRMIKGYGWKERVNGRGPGHCRKELLGGRQTDPQATEDESFAMEEDLFNADSPLAASSPESTSPPPPRPAAASTSNVSDDDVPSPTNARELVTAGMKRKLQGAASVIGKVAATASSHPANAQLLTAFPSTSGCQAPPPPPPSSKEKAGQGRRNLSTLFEKCLPPTSPPPKVQRTSDPVTVSAEEQQQLQQQQHQASVDLPVIFFCFSINSSCLQCMTFDMTFASLLTSFIQRFYVVGPGHLCLGSEQQRQQRHLQVIHRHSYSGCGAGWAGRHVSPPGQEKSHL